MASGVRQVVNVIAAYPEKDDGGPPAEAEAEVEAEAEAEVEVEAEAEAEAPPAPEAEVPEADADAAEEEASASAPLVVISTEEGEIAGSEGEATFVLNAQTAGMVRVAARVNGEAAMSDGSFNFVNVTSDVSSDERDTVRSDVTGASTRTSPCPTSTPSPSVALAGTISVSGAMSTTSIDAGSRLD